MKSVLISIQPKWVEKIASGQKTIEVRKTRPNLPTPFKCYIYCTQAKTIGDIILCKSEENAKLFGFNAVKGINKGFAEKEDINLKGKVIGEFICDSVYEWDYRQLQGLNGTINTYFPIFAEDLPKTCLTHKDLENYGKGKTLYGWHISDLKIYDKPKELSEFERPCNFKWECSICERYNRIDRICDKAIKKPPQSYMFVESLGE